MLLAAMKERLMTAMREKNKVEKEIMRVAIGEVQLMETRTGKAVPEAEIEKMLRKLITSNEEVLQHKQDEKLVEENRILAELLPQQWDKQQIADFLQAKLDEIKKPANDGQAIGVAMKFLKAEGASVDGKLVGEVVRELRVS